MLSNFGLVNFKSIGVILFELIIGQKSFDNTRIVVYFIVKVGMVSSIRSFMQTLFLVFTLHTNIIPIS
jgi:hypothetical protein